MRKILALVLLVSILSVMFVAAEDECTGVVDNSNPGGNWECISYSGTGMGLADDYTATPAFYTKGDVVAFTTTIVNKCDFDVTVKPLMYYNHITESCGDDVADGEPEEAGRTETELQYCHNNCMDTQVNVGLEGYGDVVIPAKGQKEITFNKALDQCGYYQLDIGAFGDERDNKIGWAWGFIRVLGCNEDVPEFTAASLGVAAVLAGLFIVIKRR